MPNCLKFCRFIVCAVIVMAAFEPFVAIASSDERGGSVADLVQLEIQVDDLRLLRGEEDGICGYLAENLRFSSNRGLIYPDGITLPEWHPATIEQEAFYRDALWQLSKERYGLLQGLYAHYFQQDRHYKWWRVWLENGLFLETTDVRIGDETVDLVRISDPHGWAFLFNSPNPHLIYHGASRIVRPFKMGPEIIGFSAEFIGHSVSVGAAPATDIIFYEDRAYGLFAVPAIALYGQDGLSESNYRQLSDEALQGIVSHSSVIGGKVNLAPLNQLGRSDYNDFNYCELEFQQSQH